MKIGLVWGLALYLVEGVGFAQTAPKPSAQEVPPPAAAAPAVSAPTNSPVIAPSAPASAPEIGSPITPPATLATPVAAADATQVPPVPELRLDQLTPQPDVIDNGQVRVSGPLVAPLKAKRLREVPRKVWHAISPFAPREEVDEFKGLPRISARAWTTTVGWHPGASAFGDPITHESSMGLMTVSPSSER